MVELGDRRVLAPGRWRWLRAVGWMVLLFVLVTAVFILGNTLILHAQAGAGGRAARELSRHPGAPQFAGMAVTLALTVGAYLLAVRFGEARPRPSEWALSRFLPEWLAGIGIGFMLMAATVGVMDLAGFVTVAPVHINAIWSALTVTLQSGIFEERLLRLIVFRLLWRAFGTWWALALSALLFGALHLANPNASWFAAICIAFEAGIMLAAFYVLTGRIWTSIGVHMGWNFTQGWVLGAAVSGTNEFLGGPLTTTPKASVADWLDGGGFGPEAALPALLICTAAGLWVLRRAWLAGQFAPAEPAQASVSS